MVKQTRKRWSRKWSLDHTLCPFLATPFTGMVGVSWHWQVGINPRQGSPFGGCLQSLQGTAKSQSRAHHLFHTGRVIHSHKHTEELVKQKTCILSICVCVFKYVCVCLYDYAHIYTSIDTHTLCSLLLTVHCACRNDGNTLQKYNCNLYIIVFVTIL